MTQLKALDGLARETLAIRSSGLGPARLRREEDRLVSRISDVLRPTVRKMMRHKGMMDLQDEVGQHAFIAIHTALSDWDGSISSFSTHVHWKLRAEMRTLELQHFPERRKVCENIDVRMVYLNKPCNDGQGDESDEIGEVMNLDPEGYRMIEDNVDHGMFIRNIDNALSRIAAPRISTYLSTGCSDRAPVVNVMRDIHIFVQRMLHEENARVVAACHAITRERIRQITNKVEKVFTKNIRDMMQNPRPLTEEEEAAWELALAIYREEAGYDLKLVDRGTTRSVEEIEMAYISQDGGMKKTTLAVAAAVALVSSEAGAQDHSRAIPPQENAEAEPARTVIVNSVAIESVDGEIANDLEIDDSNEWAIKLGEHPSRFALRSAANDVLRRNPELQKYNPAMIPSRNGKGIGLAFGTLDLPEATRLCSLLESRGENCIRIRIGNR